MSFVSETNILYRIFWSSAVTSEDPIVRISGARKRSIGREIPRVELSILRPDYFDLAPHLEGAQTCTHSESDKRTR
ncbi:unnamed protein product [Parnassius apollo]|uniref:(apollo) hypothetical protein n=1 Tax=Parnassius apollo TaxID=110799 RepID=A0A8S3XSF1_PARAO|nr:unnamed protein product [Parnassius apollo]